MIDPTLYAQLDQASRYQAALIRNVQAYQAQQPPHIGAALAKVAAQQKPGVPLALGREICGWYWGGLSENKVQSRLFAIAERTAPGESYAEVLHRVGTKGYLEAVRGAARTVICPAR